MKSSTRTSQYFIGTYDLHNVQHQEEIKELQKMASEFKDTIILDGRLGKSNPNAWKYQAKHREFKERNIKKNAYRHIAIEDARYCDLYVYPFKFKYGNPVV
jgi:chlorite dismutase